MATNPQKRLYTLEEWRAIEDETGLKYEYDQGQIYAMTGGRTEHAYLIGVVIFRLQEQLYGSPCRVYSSDAKIRITDDCYFCPDAVVSCDRSDYRQEEIQSPRVIVEVLSPSTEARDRNRKAKLYKTLPTLQEYVLVSSDKEQVEIHRRQAEGWTQHIFGSGDTIVLTSLDIDITMDSIYEHA